MKEKRKTIVFDKDFCIVKLDDEYWYEPDDGAEGNFELALLAREPSGLRGFRKKLKLAQRADVVGVDDFSGDYLFFAKIKTFTFRTVNALTATIALERRVGRTYIRTLKDDSRNPDILVTNPTPPSEVYLKGVGRFLDDLDFSEMDELPCSLLKTIRECNKYKYMTRIQHTDPRGRIYWVCTFFNSDELAKKFLKQYHKEEVIVGA